MTSVQSQPEQVGDYNRTYLGALFMLTVDGKEMGYFTGCQGLKITIEKIELSEIEAATGRPFKRMEAGTIGYEPITLTRGMSADTALTDWVNDFSLGTGARTTGQIDILDSTGGGILDSFGLDNCWPSSMSFDDLDASSDAKVTETLIVQHEGLWRI